MSFAKGNAWVDESINSLYSLGLTHADKLALATILMARITLTHSVNGREALAKEGDAAIARLSKHLIESVKGFFAPKVQ